MAAAQCHGLTVVTRNVQDYGMLRRALNPWDF
jgi:predicted nucleic acid-binding protein